MIGFLSEVFLVLQFNYYFFTPSVKGPLTEMLKLTLLILKYHFIKYFLFDIFMTSHPLMVSFVPPQISEERLSHVLKEMQQQHEREITKVQSKSFPASSLCEVI